MNVLHVLELEGDIVVVHPMGSIQQIHVRLEHVGAMEGEHCFLMTVGLGLGAHDEWVRGSIGAWQEGKPAQLCRQILKKKKLVF
jgi:hypothetical protein